MSFRLGGDGSAVGLNVWQSLEAEVIAYLSRLSFAKGEVFAVAQ